MGFFSGLFGAQKTKVPASGLYALPPELQALYKGVLGNAGDVIAPGGELNSQAFTPMGITPDENMAFDRARTGIAPTPDSFNQDISMLMNPYDEYVINGINREAQGQNSLVNQAGMQAGQMGSNRNFLANSDIEQNRLNNIGQFRQSQYNTAVSNALGPLADLKQGDINNLYGIGNLQRGLDLQTKQAPFNALGAGTDILANLMHEGQGTKATTVKTGGGLGGLLGGIGQIGGAVSGLGGLSSAAGAAGLGSTLGSIGSALAMFSDPRLKENIKFVGRENGHNVYEFSYRGEPQRFIGVMADEVQETHPEAVEEIEGYLAVNYGMIGVEFREAV